MISKFSGVVYKRPWKGFYGLHMFAVNNAYTKSQGTKHRKSIDLGIKILPEKWHQGAADTAWILGSDEETLNMNTRIRKLIKDLETVYLRLKQATNSEPYAEDVVKAYNDEQAKINRPRIKLKEFILRYVTDNQLTGSAAHNYECNLTAIMKRFLKDKYQVEDVYLDEVNAEFMYRYEMFLNHTKSGRGTNYKQDTIILYIDLLLAVISHGPKAGVQTADLSGYQAKSMVKEEKETKDLVENIKEAIFWKIPPQDLHKIETVQVTGSGVKGELATDTGNQYNYDLVRTRLICLLQSWTGFAYADISKHKNLRDLIINDLTGKKSIIYYRAKNGELAMIPMFDQTSKLLEALNYNAQPLCSYDTWNRRVKAMLPHYSIECPPDCVSHLFRHLCGSRMLSLGFSMESVSRILGHTSIRMTESIYARIDITKVQADYEQLKLVKQDLGTRIAI